MSGTFVTAAQAERMANRIRVLTAENTRLRLASSNKCSKCGWPKPISCEMCGQFYESLDEAPGAEE